MGVKSNSSTVALADVMLMPAAASVASSAASPVQAALPSSRSEVLGPAALSAFPVLKTTPVCIGNDAFVLVKKPIPLTDPKLDPVRHVMLVAETQGELINTLLTN